LFLLRVLRPELQRVPTQVLLAPRPLSASSQALKLYLHTSLLRPYGRGRLPSLLPP
jgi:hypothetical protein